MCPATKQKRDKASTKTNNKTRCVEMDQLNILVHHLDNPISRPDVWPRPFNSTISWARWLTNGLSLTTAAAEKIEGCALRQQSNICLCLKSQPLHPFVQPVPTRSPSGENHHPRWLLSAQSRNQFGQHVFLLCAVFKDVNGFYFSKGVGYHFIVFFFSFFLLFF